MTAPSRDEFVLLHAIARELGEKDVADDLEALRQRVEEGRFFVVCVGQFKRGKSTLLNALAGIRALPVGVVPVTTVVTVVRFGPRLRARVRTDDWSDVPFEDLALYVAEENNPDNIRGVTGVEVEVPSPLLQSGMCLVDTPGVGSVFAKNTEAARAFVPHIDVALVVLGADPPISGEELELVADVAKHADRLVFVINKADRLSEADVEQARVFTRDVLTKRLARDVGDLLVISAADRIEGRSSRDWSVLESRLQALSHEASAMLVESARRRGLRWICSRLAVAVAGHRAALLSPLEQSRAHLQALTTAVADASHSLVQLEMAFRAEEAALRKVLEQRQRDFLERAVPEVSAALLARLSTAPDDTRDLRTRGFEFAAALAQERVENWARDVRPEAERLYREATERFVLLGNDFLRRLRTTKDSGLGGLPEELEPAQEMRIPSRFHFTEMLTIGSPSPASAFWFALLSREQAIRAAHKHGVRYLARLLETNSARVTNDLVDRATESGTRLRREISRLLGAVTATARRGIERAREAQEAGEPAVKAALGRLDVVGAEIQDLIRGLEEGAETRQRASPARGVEKD